jgi:hypothetical protein
MKIFLLVLLYLGSDGRPHKVESGPYTMARCHEILVEAEKRGFAGACVAKQPESK